MAKTLLSTTDSSEVQLSDEAASLFSKWNDLKKSALSNPDVSVANYAFPVSKDVSDESGEIEKQWLEWIYSSIYSSLVERRSLKNSIVSYSTVAAPVISPWLSDRLISKNPYVMAMPYFNSLRERLRSLEEFVYGDEEASNLSSSSLEDFYKFIYRFKPNEKPSVILTESGDVKAEWWNAKFLRCSVEFLGNGQISLYWVKPSTRMAKKVCRSILQCTIDDLEEYVPKSVRTELLS